MFFGLCNAPANFQRCMVSIFSEYVENIIEVFMDDFSVFCNSFDLCLANLELVLKTMYRDQLGLKLGEMSFYGRTRDSFSAYHFQQGNRSR